MNKKGAVFTFIVIALVSVILIAFLINVSNRNALSEIQDTNVRVETLNAFTKSLNNELIPQAIKSSSTQAILSWLQYMDEVNYGTKTVTDGKFINGNLNDELKNAVLNEVYTGDGGNVQLNNMFNSDEDTNYTLPSIFGEIGTLASLSGVTFEYGNLKDYTYSISQNTPWEIKVTVSGISYNVTDNRRETFWTFDDSEFSVVLNVSNYRDPFMLVFNDQNVTINRTGIQDWNSPGAFSSFYSRYEYNEHNDAPSFLDRLQGQFDSNINGIETILDPTYFSDGSSFSNMDFKYWKQEEVMDACLVDGTNVYLDNAHISYYSRTTSDPKCNQI